MSLSSLLLLLGRYNRLNALACIVSAQRGWLGASFSCVEILTSLYFDPHLFKAERGDIVALSKGHAAVTQYACLAGLGILPAEELLRYEVQDGPQAHTDRQTPGITLNTGSLGQTLSKCIGLALARPQARIYVVLGDGELQEGQVWEAFMAWSKFGLSNLVAIIDCNGIQTDSCVSDIMPLPDLPRMLSALGLAVLQVSDGNDAAQMHSALLAAVRADHPTVVVARTYKGAGLSFTSARLVPARSYAWHGSVPDPSEYAAALCELGRDMRAASVREAALALADNLKASLGQAHSCSPAPHLVLETLSPAPVTHSTSALSPRSAFSTIPPILEAEKGPHDGPATSSLPGVQEEEEDLGVQGHNTGLENEQGREKVKVKENIKTESVEAHHSNMERTDQRLVTALLSSTHWHPSSPVVSTGSAFGEALLALAAREPLLRVLDADLEKSCHLTAVALQFAAQFLEVGVAEQNMVSIAGGLALGGALPVCNTYANFYRRAAEQIYINATERTRVIYAGHYAGLCYATDGKTHQATGDVALLRAIPGAMVVYPASPAEVVEVLAWYAGCPTLHRPLYIRLHRTPALFLTSPHPDHSSLNSNTRTTAAPTDAAAAATTETSENSFAPLATAEVLAPGIPAVDRASAAPSLNAHTMGTPFVYGCGVWIKESSGACCAVLTAGPHMAAACHSACCSIQPLHRQPDVVVLSSHTDVCTTFVQRLASRYARIAVVEELYISGGLFEEMVAALNRAGACVPVVRLAVTDFTFSTRRRTGLYEHFGLSPPQIAHWLSSTLCRE